MDKSKLIRLFKNCFDSSDAEAELLIDFAKRHGEITAEYSDSEPISVILSAPIDEIGSTYLFGCCTDKSHRSKGIFKSLIDKFSDESTILIPESDSLAEMYKRLGYSEIYHLSARIDSVANAKPFEGDINKLYEAYKKSFLFPKKDFPLFEASIKAFKLYGGEIYEYKNSAILINGREITEIYCESEEGYLESALNSAGGEININLPIKCSEILNKNRIKFIKKRSAMVKNLNYPSGGIYINNLFN